MSQAAQLTTVQREQQDQGRKKLTSKEKEVLELLQAKSRGRWVTEKVYAAAFGLSAQTLTNWRSADLQADRSSAPEGYPTYKRFGRCVRYWLPEESL